MRAGAAQVQAWDRCAVIRPTGDRPERAYLVRSHLPVRLMRFRQAEPALQVERRDDVAGEDRLRDVRGVLGERLDHAVPVGLPELVPRTRRKMVGAVLNVDRQRVLPGRRYGWVEDALRHDLEPGMLGGTSVLCIEKRVFD